MIHYCTFCRYGKRFSSSVYLAIKACDGCVLSMNHSSNLGTSDTGSMKVRLRFLFSASTTTPGLRENGFWFDPSGFWVCIPFEGDIILGKEWCSGEEWCRCIFISTCNIFKDNFENLMLKFSWYSIINPLTWVKELI